jgi:hypothetical protein
MPRNITATLEDGTKVVYQNVPDQVKPEEVISRVMKEHKQGVLELDGGRGNSKTDPTTLVGTEKGRYQNRPVPGQTPPIQAGAPQAQPSPAESGFLGTLKGIGSDITRGAGQTLSFLSQGAAAFNDTQSVFGKKAAPRNYNELTEKVRETLPVPDPESEGAGRKYLRAGLESVGGGLILPLGGVGPIAQASNFMGGVGSEAAANTLGDNLATRLLGGLAGGFGTSFGLKSLANTVKPNAGRLAKEGLEGISDTQLAKAQEFQAEAAKRSGVDMDLVQALEAVGVPAGNLAKIRNTIANSQHGDNVQRVLQDQPKQLETLGDLTIAGLPGKARASDVAANNLQDAATGAVNQARATRTAATRPYYEQAGNLPSSFRTKFANELSETLNRPGIPADAAGKVKEALDRLKAAPGTGAAMTHAADYDQLIRDVAGPWNGTPLSGSGNAFLGELTGRLKTTLRAAAPELEKGAAIHAQMSQDLVDPLKKELVGQFATRRGALPDVAASQKRFTSLMDAGEAVGGKQSNIRAFAGELKKVDPEAFPDALKTYMTEKMGKAVPAQTTRDLSSPGLADSIHRSFFANRNQFNGLKQAASASAESMGLPPADVVRGLENFAQITAALRNRPAGVGSLAGSEVHGIAAKSIAAEGLRTLGLVPFAGAARWINELRLGKTYKEFDKLLTSPEGAARLAELGKAKLGTQRAMEAFLNLGGVPTQVESGANAPGITRE